ncbi:MAG: hypothetical protein EOP13_01225 [Pseudomonas sp.]|uniref:DUF6894 family protein n=1 Tax=Pseudomonas sp. TaxID=306 RepID=UPI001219D97B|nr:hypothetical protein [Pseudomonas sp.]RZI76714.1 MAG: hypothetical protein EOP13_01225 [Pseudomonas sp.]
MPLFFFDIHNDLETRDEEGSECADEAAALKRAHEAARHLAAESVREHGHLILDHRIVVRNDADGTVSEVRFDEAVTVRASDKAS